MQSSIYESEVSFVHMEEVELKLDELMSQCTSIQIQFDLIIHKEINQIYLKRKRILEAIHTNINAFDNHLINGDV